MKRRLFVSNFLAGLLVCLYPASLLASASQRRQSVESVAHRQLAKLAQLIDWGRIGIPQQLSVSHSYSAEKTSLSELRAIAQRDFDLMEQLLGRKLGFDAQSIFTHPDSAAFGSFATEFDNEGLTILWQGLARVGTPPAHPIGTLRLSGSKAILHLKLDSLQYELIDFQ